jgi:hypothetical protein
LRHRDPILDAYCANFFNEHDPNYPFLKIEMIQCLPSDIHIIDVHMLDLTRPANDPPTEGAPRSHHGLHLFGQLLDRLKHVAAARGVERISLVAASPAAHDVFSRYGFKVSGAPASQYAWKNVGFSHGMVLSL